MQGAWIVSVHGWQVYCSTLLTLHPWVSMTVDQVRGVEATHLIQLQEVGPVWVQTRACLVMLIVMESPQTWAFLQLSQALVVEVRLDLAVKWIVMDRSWLHGLLHCLEVHRGHLVWDHVVQVLVVI